MKGLNKAQVIWTIGSDLELKETQNWKKVLAFTMATNEKYTDGDGVVQEVTDWHNIVAWWKAAEIIAEYMSKWSNLYVEGKMRTRSWEKEDWSKGYKTEIIVSDFTFIPSGNWTGASESDPKASETKTTNKKAAPAKKAAAPVDDEISIEDIPF